MWKVPRFSFSGVLEQADHFQCGHGTVIALVACLGAGTLDCLFNGIGSQHAEQYRQTGLQSYLCNALGNFCTNIVVVAGGTADPFESFLSVTDEALLH